MRAECIDTRSKAMQMLTVDQLCTLLKYALQRMKHEGVSNINFWSKIKLVHLSHAMRKSVFGDSTQVQHKPACSPTEAS